MIRSTALAAIVAAAAVPATAQPAPAPVAASPAAFLQSLGDRAFALLRDRAQPAPERNRRLRALLTANFAVDEIGDRLIRRHRAAITPAQLAAYRTAFPAFVVGAYADRLEPFSDATLTIVRTVPRPGGEDVVARVSQPSKRPVDTVWAVRGGAGRYRITNITVSGINLALTQEEDFRAIIERQGFDALVQFMRTRAA